MGHGMIVRYVATGALILAVLAPVDGANRSEALERARRKAAESPKQGGQRRDPAHFPKREAVVGGDALALWPQFSAVLHDRMHRANRKVTLNVMGTLEGADMTVSRTKDDQQRSIALAQIQAACAMFLVTPGIPLTVDERDLLAAYAAKAGEARVSGGPTPKEPRERR